MTSPSPPPGVEKLSVSNGPAAHEYRYSAFISYRQLPLDRRWAIWLQQTIEGYRVPRKAAIEHHLPRRLKSAFRDEEELAASSELSGELRRALDESAFLIVICSNRTAESKWVDAEIQYFRSLNRSDHVLALLVEGEPPATFPMSLRALSGDDAGSARDDEGLVGGTEALAADVRPQAGRSGRYMQRLAALRILAALLECRFNDLRRREETRARQRFAALAAVIATVLLVIGLMGIAYMFQRARTTAARSDRLAQASQAAARRQDFAGAGLLALESLKLTTNETALESLALSKAWSWRLLSAQQDHRGSLSNVSYSADGHWLLTTAYFGDNNVVRLWDAEAVNSGPRLVQHSRVRTASFHPNSRRIAVTDYDDRVWIWDFDSQGASVACSFSHKDVVNAVFESSGRFVVSYSSDAARVWSLDGCSGGAFESQPIAEVENQDLTSFRQIPLARSFLTISATGAVLWRLEGQQPLITRTLRQHGLITDTDISPDGSRAVTSDKDGVARIWDISAPTAVMRQELHHDGMINTARFSADGQLLVTSSEDGTAKLWEKSSADTFRLKHLLAHGAELKAARVDPSGRYVISWNYPRIDAGPGALDGNILWIWDVTSGRRTAILLSDVTAADFSPDGKLLAIAGFDSRVRIWRVGSPRIEIPRDGSVGSDPYDAEKIAFGYDANDKLILADRCDQRVRVWNVPQGTERFPPVALGDQTLPTVLIAAGGTQIIATDPNQVSRWNATSGQPVPAEPDENTSFHWHTSRHCVLVVKEKLAPELHNHGPAGYGTSDGWRTGRDAGDAQDRQRAPLYVQDIRTVKTYRIPSRLETIEQSIVSADGRHAVVAGMQPDSSHLHVRPTQRVEIWNLADETVVGSFQAEADLKAIDPTGRSAVSTAGPNTRFTVFVAGETIPRVLDQDGWVMSASYNPDGSRLITSSRDGSAWIWDTSTWEHVRTLTHGVWVADAVYDPKGEVIATAATDGSTKIWNASTCALLCVLQHQESQRLCLFSPDSKILVGLSRQTATIWRWRDEIIDAADEELRLRLASARQLDGLHSEAEAWLDIPAELPRPNPEDTIVAAARKLKSGPPTRSTINSAVERVLEAPDPSLGWIELYTALGGHPRSNGYRLLVLEELERRLNRPSFSKNQVLRLLIDASRAAGLHDDRGGEDAGDRAREAIRARAQQLRSKGSHHPIVAALASWAAPPNTADGH